MNPYTQAYLPVQSHQKSEDVAFLTSNTTTSSSIPNPVLSDFQSLPLRAFGAPGQIASQFITPSRDLHVSLEDDTGEELTPRPRQTQASSSVSSSVHPLLQQSLNELSIHDHSVTPQAQNANAVTDPKNMPIGSLADRMELPAWGVIKISNIPYSITKQEIIQFLGRQARLINTHQGCPVHIIMDRSTAKTMDCYVELQTRKEAADTVIRINRLFETGRAPRLGSRHVDVELSDQDKLLKDLFPRAKCIDWQDGMPYLLPNNDPWSSGFIGFCTNEEIILAIRHAEQPNRSNFGEKCPQRTYESAISTLHKFPWYATTLYTVHDRNQLFDLTNRHILALSTRINSENTVGLDQKLLHDLLQAGLKCPAFNERQKYTLCMNSDIASEINKLPVLSKWFPFDTLARKPEITEDINKRYAHYISQGTSVSSSGQLIRPGPGVFGLNNNYPQDQPHLRSPYGPIWFEWPEAVSNNVSWNDAVDHEMDILSAIVSNGWHWIHDDMNRVLGSRRFSTASSFSIASGDHPLSLDLSSHGIEQSQTSTDSSSSGCGYMTPFRRASESAGAGKQVRFSETSSPWGRKVLLDLPARATPAHRGHRNTKSSPMCLPSPSINPWKGMDYE